MEAVGYDPSQLSVLHTLIVIAGTWSEFLLPLMIVVGLLTRLAALGMIGFVLVQSFVDVTGHGVGGRDLGAWSMPPPFTDHRSAKLLGVPVHLIVLKGAGPFSLDRYLSAEGADPQPD